MIILLKLFNESTTNTLSAFNISYDLAGGTNSSENPIAYDENSNEIKLKDASKEGYTFDGWYSDSSYTEEFDAKTLNGNIIIYAKFTPIEYSITYNLDNGTNSPNNPSRYTIETNDITLANPTKEGYVFEGWYKEAGFINKVIVIEQGTIGNLSLYAKWSVDNCDVTFHINGGSFNKTSQKTKVSVNYGTCVTEPIANKYLYKFGGWYTEETCQDVNLFDFNTPITSDMHLYAKWNEMFKFGVIDMGDYYAVIITGRGSITANNIIIPDEIEVDDYGMLPVVSIYEQAFINDDTITSVSFGNNVSYIDYKAFYDCDNISYIVLPIGIEWVDDSAIYECDNLSKVYYKGTNKSEIVDASDSNNDYIEYDDYITWVYYMENPSEMGNWWYYDSNGNICEVRIR